MARPEFPAFLSSLFIGFYSERPAAVTLSAAVLSSLLQVYLVMCASQVLMLFCGPIVLFMFTMYDLLFGRVSSPSALKLGLTSVRKVLQMRERLTREIRLYRSLQLLTEEVNDLFASTLGETHGVVTLALICLAYGVLRCEGLLAVMMVYMFCWSFGSYFLLMNKLANINLGSKSLLRCIDSSFRSVYGGNVIAIVTFASAKEAKIVQRELRNMRELRLRGGSSVFYFDKKLILTVVYVVMSQSISLRIMF